MLNHLIQILQPCLILTTFKASSLVHQLFGTKQSTILISDLLEPTWLREKQQLRCALVITDDWLSIRDSATPIQAVLVGDSQLTNPQVPIMVHHFSDTTRYVATRVVCPNRDWIPMGSNLSTIRWEPKFGCPSQVPFKVSYRGLPPYIYHLPTTASKGLDIDLARILAQKLTMNLELFEFDIWIEIDPLTGVLGGSVGLVMNDTYDMVVGNLPFPVGAIRESTELTTFIYDLDIKMATAKPSPLTPFLNVIRPFSPEIWMISIGTIVCCGIVFSFKSRTHQIRSQVILWWMLGVLLSQSRSSKCLRRAKVHLIMVVWMFFTICLKYFYECNFRANLIAVDYEPIADSIPELVKLGRRLYIPSGTQFQDMLDGYPDQNFKFLGQMARQEGLIFEYDEQGLVEYEAEQIILKNGDGFLLNEYMGLATFGNLEDRYDGRNPYRISKNVIFPSMGYFLTRVNYPYLVDLDRIILSLYESGIPNHLRKSYISPKYLIKSQDQVVQMEPFQLEQVFTAFLILGTGLILSCFVFAWQLYTHEVEY